MKELDALMKALNEKGIPESLRKTTKLVPFPKETDTPEKKQELIKPRPLDSVFGHNGRINLNI